jgi:hypothetical protein
MSKLGLALLGGITAVGIASIVLASDMTASGGKKVTITGEVRDISCYTTAGLEGMKHVPCAKSCVLNGQELGIQMADGTMLMVLGKGPNDAPNKKLLPYVEQKVTVTGTEFRPPSFYGISIDSIAPAGG